MKEPNKSAEERKMLKKGFIPEQLLFIQYPRVTVNKCKKYE